MAEPARAAAIEHETKIPWEQWCAHLDSVGGPDLTHKQIAMRAEEFMPPAVNNPAWWGQTVAVAYTQHLGRRVPGQRQDGSFEFTVTRTLEGNLNQAFARWMEFIDDRDTFADAALREEPTTRSTNQWRRWRAWLDDGSRVEVEVALRSGKTVIAATHSKLRSTADLEARRAWWKALLGDI